MQVNSLDLDTFGRRGGSVIQRRWSDGMPCASLPRVQRSDWTCWIRTWGGRHDDNLHALHCRLAFQLCGWGEQLWIARNAAEATTTA